MRTKVKFSLGEAHPLYGKFVLAEVKTGLGYNGRCIEGTTCEPVHYPADPEGIFVFDKKDRFVRCETRPAYDEVWTGWVDALEIDGKVVSAKEYGEYVEYLRLKAKFEPANRLYGEFDECDEYGCPQHDGERVAWVYAHGKLEDDMCHDCFYADNADVKNGDKAVYKGKEVVFHLYPLRGRLTGIACYTDDQEAMTYGQSLVKEQPQLF